MEIPDELVTTLLRRDCVLFAGAGVTQDTGGKSWSGLVGELIKQFNYDSPFSEDWENHPERYQEIIDDIFDSNNPQEVYEKVQEILQGAYIDQELIPLIRLPWYSIFTTNYDSALEKSLRENQTDKTIIPVTSGEQYILPGKNRELYIVYLMGCIEHPYNSNGSMILTTANKNLAERNRIKIYDELGNHVAKLSFVFIGYSFDDNLFIETVKRVREKVGKDTKKFFAIFRDEIQDPRKKYRLEKLGVQIIFGDFKEFAKKLAEKYQLHDSSNYTKIRLLIGSNIIPLEKSRIYDFLDNYRPVDFNSVTESAKPIQFFRGKVEGFFPFKEEWHYKRKESDILNDYIINGINGQPAKIICIAGDLGAGRTTIIKSSIYELISKYNSLAIQIQKYANPFPDKDQIKIFFNEVSTQAEKLDKQKPERLIFWAEFTPDPRLVLKFRDIAKDLHFPIHFIFEEVANEKYVDDLTRNFDLIRIDITNNIVHEDEEKLINYIHNIVVTHQLPQITFEEISRIAKQEQQFFPIMYRTLHPTKQSIDDIIQEEFSKINDDDELKDLIIYCSIASSVNLEIPHTVLLKVCRLKFEDPDLIYDYIYDLGNKAPQFINIIPDEQTEYLFSIYHPIIAQKIVASIGKKVIDKYLGDIVRITNLTLGTDAQFISNLLITKGENSFKFPQTYYKFPSSSEGLLKAFKFLCDTQPARPILHHYAILIHILSPHDESVISILESALRESKEKYDMDEPKEYIFVSLARMRWDLNKDRLVKRPRDDPEILEIFSILDSAKTETDSSHPYHLQGRILMDLWDNGENDEIKLRLLSEAVSILEEAYAVLQNDDYKGQMRIGLLSERIFSAISSTDPKAASYLADEFAVRGDGTGYYYISYLAYTDRKIDECLKYLDLAMKCHYYPYSTVILKMKILMDFDNPPYHEELLQLVDIFTVEQKETWESALIKGIIYTLNSAPTGVKRFFRLAFKKAPLDKKTKILFQIKENGKNKKFYGKISPDLSEKEGHIYGHNIKEIKREIFFDPRSGSNWKPLRVGMMVEFTLGFNTLSEVATDIKPYDPTQTKIETYAKRTQ